MAPSNATRIRIGVQSNNPGQFLACCGLLSIASTHDREAEACFAKDGGFVILSRTNPIEALRSARVTAVGYHHTSPSDANRLVDLQQKGKSRSKDESSELAALQDGPMALSWGDSTMRLDWWTDPVMQDAGFKTWAGGQHAFGFLDGMLGHLADVEQDEVFASRPVSSPKPFYFDSRVSRLTSLDLGFSPEGFTTCFSPAVELLAFIGLQLFRPTTIHRRQVYGFATWSDPLPLEAAMIAATGLAPALCDRHFRFPLVRRTGGKYKAFGPAVEAAVQPSSTNLLGDTDA